MRKKVFDDLSLRFIIPLTNEDLNQHERLLFAIEEAHWFYTDFYKHQTEKLNFKQFTESLLRYNNMRFSLAEYRDFMRYKKNVPVCGAILFNQHFNKILLVRGYNQRSFYFPKGKKSRDELPEECAIREVYEEVGYNIEEKIIGDGIAVDRRLRLFPVINVREEEIFITKTRNEIAQIKWVPISTIRSSSDMDYSFIKKHLELIVSLQDEFMKTRFRFNMERFDQIWK
ncbi:hypothetical protein EDEG_02292 [Edhazardia aedis USNM 41457]|uniref:Nudix hydrolase domain-containing protein n=1 Tax=Edhazardia aedis (strain USNM 41457) TaxID=1003232 RepID=J9DPT5_EDHAE|nr:hypothetical protein EDEG_02292 [Edhazardia aedis USNM 41457]|eukprot:EJW03382.1 hypothetical protein EDEG_02292 [Edhazardia aedis USNM 41457]